MASNRKYSKNVRAKAKSLNVIQIPNTLTFRTEESRTRYITEVFPEYAHIEECGDITPQENPDYYQRVKNEYIKHHFVIYNSQKQDWTCDCWYFANRTAGNFTENGYCSHILAVLEK